MVSHGCCYSHCFRKLAWQDISLAACTQHLWESVKFVVFVLVLAILEVFAACTKVPS